MTSRSRPAARGLAAALVAAVLASLVSAPALAAEEPPDTTVSWGARPADTAEGQGRPNFVYQEEPGSSVRDALRVTNRGDQPLELAVYAADGVTTDDGALDLVASPEDSTELGAWIEVSEPDISLDPGEAVDVPFTMEVPDDAQPGDYAAGVVAAMRVSSEDGITTERRLGSRVLLRVAGDLAPGIAVSDLSVDYRGGLNPFSAGEATVDFRLTNTGNATLDAGADLALGGLFGWGAKEVSGGEMPDLLPGASVSRTVVVDGVWPLAIAAADLVAAGEVVVRDGAVPPLNRTVADEGSAMAWAVPWTLLALVVAGALLIAGRVLLARRRARRQKRAVDAAVAEAVTRERERQLEDAR